MVKYIIKRIRVSILVFIGITFLIFMLSNLAPGGPLDLLTSEANLSDEALEELKHSLGLDRPAIVRYFEWLTDFFKGDWGTSYKYGTSISLLISQRIGPTLLLMGVSLGVAILTGVPIGILVSEKPYGMLDYTSNTIAFLGQAIPTFFYSLVLMYVLSIKLKWLPLLGMHTTGVVSIGDTIKHLVMPVMVLSWRFTATFIRHTRAAMLEVKNSEHVKTAKSKGIPYSAVVIKHVFRNALIPIVTQIGLQVPLLIGGSVVVEQIFSWPGIGSLLVTSIENRDYPVIMGVSCLVALAVLVINLLLDVLYAKLDPRISYK
ncbi:MAG TPA: ABC transporter permease [Sphaerochaeta sp.]|nr:ABC transporter permease [Sphaerochaeta sp.]